MESKRAVKLFAVLLGLVLLIPAGLSAQDDERAEPAPPVDEAQPPPEGEDVPPEKPKSRLRPVTEAEEEEYKRQAVREDPFLNSPLGPDPRNLAYYRPIDFLRPVIVFDRSRYIVQNGSSTLLGFLTIDVAPFAAPSEDLVRMSLDYAAPRRRVELLFESQHLKPRSVLVFAPATLPQPQPLDPKKAKPLAKAQKNQKQQSRSKVAAEEQPAPAPELEESRTEIEYLFDRVTIERDAGLVATQERMRQLPYSFDIEQLPLLVRQLDFERLARQWPFEALITAPEQKRSLQLRIDEPKKVEVMSAEPQSRPVYELKMRLGETDSWTWWVERVAPYRLVKFTDGRNTYTLNQYDPGPGQY